MIHRTEQSPLRRGEVMNLQLKRTVSVKVGTPISTMACPDHSRRLRSISEICANNSISRSDIYDSLAP